MDADDPGAPPDEKTPVEKTPEEKARNEERIKMLAKVVCICKGINLGRVLKGLEGSETVADVNRKVGTGCGGCQGERCGPRIRVLLKKYKESKAR